MYLSDRDPHDRTVVFSDVETLKTQKSVTELVLHPTMKKMKKNSVAFKTLNFGHFETILS